MADHLKAVPNEPEHVSFCAIHDVTEAQPEGSTTCFECGHVFPDDENIVAEYNETFKDEAYYEPKVAADTVMFCPLCLHDW